MINSDEKYMKRCFKLALKGKNKVKPNPMVGCVVLDKDGNLISEGYHHKYGAIHAERDALLKLDKKDAIGGTLYVNLEPCSHYGKTPPCVDLIIERKLSKVIIGMKDVNPKVDGITKLKKAGINVKVGVLKEEAEFLNRIFIKNMTKKLPYVVLKTATTMDGKIATKTGDSKWITSDEARNLVYKMRKEFDCILTSSKTILADNPKMTHKYKCIIDKEYKTKGAQIYDNGKFYIATKENTPTLNGQLNIKHVLQTLFKQGIYTVFVECGGTLAGSMLKSGLVDEIYQFIAPKILNDNDGQSCFNGEKINKICKSKNLRIYSTKIIGNDLLIKSIILNQ